MSTEFIHLRLHTEYSLRDGIVRIKPLCNALKAMHMPACAVTDYTNFFALVKFYKTLQTAGIKPIIGADIRITNPEDAKNPFHLLLLCQNEIGYRNLSALISKAYQQGQQTGDPLVEKTWLDVENMQGLIALSGARKGDVGVALLQNNNKLAQTRLQHWQTIFPNRFYAEVQRTGRMQEEEYIAALLPLVSALAIPIVATNDVCFLQADDFEAHEARVCIYQGFTLNDAARPRDYSEMQYLRSSAEMQSLFADLPSALQNSVVIAKRCNFILNLSTTYLPHFPVPAGETAEQYLAQLATEGLAERLHLRHGENIPAAIQERYHERLQVELSVINKMGFAGYFLIVADFIAWSKRHQIPVGPGRGSGAGSIVAYTIGITGLDPLDYDLLFERFLNPERVSMPDFDIDFCMDRRDEVIEYVAERYGRENVAQIITFGSMAARAVVRDVGRVLGHPYGFVDKIAKLIPFELGITLEKALAQEALLREAYENDQEVNQLLQLAKKLEGLARNAGKHAGGVVIAPKPLMEFAPLYCESNGHGVVTQLDKNDVEAIGLVKFDFLGLRTLTIIAWALQTINLRRAQQALAPINIELLPIDDKSTYNLLKTCSTTAVFQLESRGMKDLVKRLQADCFEDIIALVALFRPGPLQSGMVDDFINRKHGRAEVSYLHPLLEPILKPTYGIIVYQEQVMQIAQVLAGYSLGEADLLRRAMGKKKVEEMAKQRAIFLAGAKTKNVAEQSASQIFDLMEMFADYGFNKSHSAAYALVTYQTAWLKAHYPAAFMAAVLSADMDNTDKIVSLIEECNAMGLKWQHPDVNSSQYHFTIDAENVIIYGFGAIKGVGQSVCEHIVAVRNQGGVYTDLFNFCARVDLHKINRRALEALIRSGSMDSFGQHRASLLESINSALQHADQAAKNKQSGQVDMFAGLTQASSFTPSYIEKPVWTSRERLRGEKETLGHYLTGHPLDQYRVELKQWVKTSIADLRPSSNQSITVAGFIVAIRTLLSKRGDRIAFLTLDDGSGRVEMAVFAEAYQMYRAVLVKDQLLIVEGDVSVDDYSGGYRISCKRITTLAQMREQCARSLLLHLQAEQIDAKFTDQLKTILQPHVPGTCAVLVNYQHSHVQAQLKLGEEWEVKPTENLLTSLREWLGETRVQVYYS